MASYVSAWLINLALALAASLLWYVSAFGVSKVVHRHAIVDVFWGAGFTVIFAESLLSSWLQSRHSTTAWFHVHSSDLTARVVIFSAVACWSVRLSGYLALRQRGAGEDSRYVMIMRGAKGNPDLFALRNIYLLQALLAWFISLPLQFIAFAPRFTAWAVTLGLVLIALGIVFEGTGDAQLARFLGDPNNRGRTMNQGLWRYTRHPNYFGDAVVWWGIFACAAATGWGSLTVLSPIAMTWLLTSFSGKPLLERKLTKTREGYEEYLAITSSFVPRPPKRGATK